MILVVLSLITGVILGVVLPTQMTASLGHTGKLFIQMIKAVAAPLLFFAIIDSFLSVAIRGKDLIKMFKIAAINALAAIIIALLLANIFQPGQYMDLKSYKVQSTNNSSAPTATQLVEKLFPKSLVEPFAENNVFAIVVLAVLIGFALRKSTQDFSSVHQPVQVLYRVLEKILIWMTRLAPIAILGVTAKAVGEKGVGVFVGLSSYVLLCATGLLLQVLIVYSAWIKFYVRIPLLRFYRQSRSALTHAFGINSSLATLHLTLQSAERLGASPHAARIVSCVGTNFNNDGILLYEAAAVLFIAQAMGLDLNFFQQLGVMLTCVVAALGVSGVPEAGIISLTLVVSAAGLPVEVIPILLSVDWFVARLRSSVNVMSDITGSLILNKQLKG